jgi:hypothetical protein
MNSEKKLVIQGKVWRWEGPAAWYFLATSPEQGELLRSKKRVGWGSLRVRVQIGETVFETSLFPTKEGPYLLPIKKSIRKSEGLDNGSEVVAECVFL